ncbi:hypothetical protein [Cerasicoccus arenae]|uniref:Uncharacterized protein n=1 Tax=Cerasicoccus arenae TaxID=424488 RepID=A0A8J3GEW7_9BACT|nr:hypothetical protein [Cerasicoccus arenae]MBK1859983.1 hypothetical protein [Cerasicoccus arenae]GHC12448.1 hypothetical protein GCM10007047_32330 [Cerasicoccus arenae]
MKTTPAHLLAFLVFTLLTATVCSAESITIPLAIDKWDVAREAKLGKADGELRVKSLASSVWLVPQERIRYEDGDVLDIRYVLRGGNLVFQLNWFDASGDFLETTTIGKATSAKNEAIFRVSCSDKVKEAGPQYELKIWIEADMPSLSIESIKIIRGVQNLPFLTKDDFESSDTISVSQLESGSLILEQAGSGQTSSILTQKRFSLKDASRLKIDIEDVAPSSAFSLQMIFWSDSGSYLGHVDILQDITTARSEVVDAGSLDVPAGATKYSFKLWLSGASASATLMLSEDS